MRREPLQPGAFEPTSSRCPLVHSNIGEPREVEGHNYTASAGAHTSTPFPALASAAGPDLSKVENISVDFRAVLTGLTFWGFESVGALIWFRPITAQYEFDVESRCFLWKRYGKETGSYGLITSQHMIEKNLEIVAHFVDATRCGFEYLYYYPRESIGIAREVAPPEMTATLPSDRTTSLVFRLQPALLNILDWRRLGLMADDGLAETITVLAGYANMEVTPSPSDVFTNDFSP